MLGWVVGGVSTFVVSLAVACVFLQLRCRGIGPPFGPHARPWGVFIALATALVSTGIGLLILAVSHETSAALAGLVVPGGLWLTNVSAPRDRLRAGWLTRPLSNLYDAMGDDMQAWCDIRHRAATEEPQWTSDAVKYYYDQVKGRIKDRRALEELCDWRDSIVHKVSIVRLINLETTPARLRNALQKHPSTQNLRRYADDDLQRLARRLESDATNELDLFLAKVYRLGYHKLLIYPFRPSAHRTPAPSYQVQTSGALRKVQLSARPVSGVSPSSEPDHVSSAMSQARFWRDETVARRMITAGCGVIAGSAVGAGVALAGSTTAIAAVTGVGVFFAATAAVQLSAASGTQPRSGARTDRQAQQGVHAEAEHAENEDDEGLADGGDDGIGNGGNGPGNGEGDDASSDHVAWPRLSCDAAVVAGTTFDLTVGLAGEEDTSLYGTGRLRVPARECELHIEIQASGFVIQRGIRKFALRVTPDDPFPFRALRLKPTEDPGFRNRRIGALFTIDGELRGYAARDVIVVATHDEAAAVRERGHEDADVKPGRQSNVLSGGGGVPDLTITIVKDARQPTTLLWSAISPHVEMPFTVEPPRSDLGNPTAFLSDVIRKASEAFSVEHGFQTLLGMGVAIAGHIPAEIQDAIRQVAGYCHPGPPAILLATQDPYIPWELAVLKPSIGVSEDGPPFLGAQAIIGRWPLPKPPPPPRRPPQSVAVNDRAVITGSYVGVMGATQLPDAEEEAERLLEAWPGARRIPASFREVMDCLGGDPPADLLHFALHGRFDESGRQEGIFLIGKQPDEGGSARVEILSPFDVRGKSLGERAPLVFLNACQIGASREVLGDYAGMAEAFLHAGASAVIAPLWSIDDGAAKTLALSFYESASGANAKPPAEILREERARLDERSVRDDSPPPLICLSYQFFGHPRFRMMHAVHKEA